MRRRSYLNTGDNPAGLRQARWVITPSIDHLFDRGFISFEDSGETLISPVADPDSLRRMGVNVEAPPRVGGFNSDQCYFLHHHRSSIFLAGVSD
jgi:hypothetical protein